MRRFVSRAAAAAVLAATFLACGGGEGRPDEPRPGPSASSAPALACRLPAPLESQDPCSADADCAPSEPCHARACVARAKADPPKPDTICTQSMECATVDANPCRCHRGVCALVPPS